MTQPLTLALIGVAGCVAALVGVRQRRNLDRLRYRYSDETDMAPPGARSWVPPVTTGACVTVAGIAGFTDQPWLAMPLAPLALTGAWLAAVDNDVQRLPNRVLTPTAACTVVAVAAVAVVTGQLWWRPWPCSVPSWLAARSWRSI